MTVSHVVVILVYTILSYLGLNVFRQIALSDARTLTTWNFVGGVSDLFIALNIWFILDEKKTPEVFRQGNWSYAVLNVVRPVTAINNDNN